MTHFLMLEIKLMLLHLGKDNKKESRFLSIKNSKNIESINPVIKATVTIKGTVQNFVSIR